MRDPYGNRNIKQKLQEQFCPPCPVNKKFPKGTAMASFLVGALSTIAILAILPKKRGSFSNTDQFGRVYKYPKYYVSFEGPGFQSNFPGIRALVVSDVNDQPVFTIAAQAATPVFGTEADLDIFALTEFLKKEGHIPLNGVVTYGGISSSTFGSAPPQEQEMVVANVQGIGPTLTDMEIINGVRNGTIPVNSPTFLNHAFNLRKDSRRLTHFDGTQMTGKEIWQLLHTYKAAEQIVQNYPKIIGLRPHPMARPQYNKAVRAKQTIQKYERDWRVVTKILGRGGAGKILQTAIPNIPLLS